MKENGDRFVRPENSLTQRVARFYDVLELVNSRAGVLHNFLVNFALAALLVSGIWSLLKH